MPQRRSRHADRLAEFGDLALEGDAVFSRRGRWREAFATRIGDGFGGRVIVEIGCHDASFLAQVAQRHPSIGFVGIDWKPRFIAEGAERLRDARLSNVLLLNGRAQQLDQIFAAREIDEAWIFHPEPCATPREARNRLITESFLLMLVSRLRDVSSRIVFKTDHAGYFQHVLALLGEPEPGMFMAYRRGGPDRPRLRKDDLVDESTLPAVSDALRSALRVVCRFDDTSTDPQFLAATQDRPFAGLTTTYERHFLKKRLPIFFIELAPRAAED